MVDQVNIVSVDGHRAPPWATEDTLQEIAGYVSTLANLQRTQNKTDKTKSTTDQKVAQQGNKAIVSLLAPMKFTSKSITRLLKATIAGGNSLETVMKRTAQDQIEALNNLSMGRTGITGGIFSLVGLLGTVAVTALGLFVSKISQASDAFTTLYDTGFSFGGQLGTMYIEAGKAGLSLSEFSRVISENAMVVKQLTNDYETGTYAFGQMSKSIRTNLMANGKLALSTSEINDYLGEYLETQRLQGRLDTFDRIKTQRHLTEYLETLTKLSHISGKRRKQIFDEVQAVKRQTDINLFLATMPETVSKSFDQMASMIAGLDIDDLVMKGFLDLMRFGNFTDSTKMLSTLGDDTVSSMHTIAAAMARGEDVDAAIKDFVTTIQDDVERLKASGQMRRFADAAALGMSQFEGINQVMASVLASAKMQEEASSISVGALFNLGVALSELWARVGGRVDVEFGKMINRLTGILESGELDKDVSDSFDTVLGTIDSLLDTATMQTVLKGFVDVVGWGIKTFIKLFNPDGRKEIKQEIIGALTSIIAGIGEAISNAISNYFFGSKKEQLTKALTDYETQLEKPYNPAIIRTTEQRIQNLAAGNSELIDMLSEQQRNLIKSAQEFKGSKVGPGYFFQPATTGGPGHELEGSNATIKEPNRSAVRFRGGVGPGPDFSNAAFLETYIQSIETKQAERERAESSRHRDLSDGILRMNDTLKKINSSVIRSGERLN